MALSPDSPIEELKLSIRVRNVLHLSGLHTLRNLLECDYKTAVRGLGPGARAELARALASNGFAPPANLIRSERERYSKDVSKLFGQIESGFRKWNARLHHFEARIEELTVKGRERQQQFPAELSQQAQACAGLEQAREFSTRLAAICVASATLRETADLPQKQQENAASMEQESLRLSIAAGRLLEMLPWAEPASSLTPNNPAGTDRC